LDPDLIVLAFGAACFGAGYGTRALISRLRRRRARYWFGSARTSLSAGAQDRLRVSVPDGAQRRRRRTAKKQRLPDLMRWGAARLRAAKPRLTDQE
jgi:hypothetical protein